MNKKSRQSGTLNDMIFSIPQPISCLLPIFTLYLGDLICTGTTQAVVEVHKAPSHIETYKVVDAYETEHYIGPLVDVWPAF